MTVAMMIQKALPEAIVFDGEDRVHIMVPIAGRWDVPGDEALYVMGGIAGLGMVEGAIISEDDQHWYFYVML